MSGDSPLQPPAKQSTEGDPASTVKPDQAPIKEDISAFIEALPIEEKKKFAAIALMTKQTSMMHSGPLPPPEMLKQYNDIIPNGAERMMVMAEKQSSHRRSLESTTVATQQKQGLRGQIFGLIVAIFGLGAAFVAAILGHDTFASIIGTVDLVGLVGVFVTGQYFQKLEMSEKREQMNRVDPSSGPSENPAQIEDNTAQI